jgi:hypothetical protein
MKFNKMNNSKASIMTLLKDKMMMFKMKFNRLIRFRKKLKMFSLYKQMKNLNTNFH